MNLIDRARQVWILEQRWGGDEQWHGIRRNYRPEDVVRMRGSVRIEHSLARRGAERLRGLLDTEGYSAALITTTSAQVVDLVHTGVQAIYVSGPGAMASEPSAAEIALPTCEGVAARVRRLNQALLRADQLDWSQGSTNRDWLVPIIARGEAACDGSTNPFDRVKSLIEAGVAGVQFEDQFGTTEQCGAVLMPTSTFVNRLNAARLAADVADVPTVVIARTAALSAKLLTSDTDARDRFFLTGDITAEGYWVVADGLGAAIARGLAYAPYADVLWVDTPRPELEDARRFAAVIHAHHPGKWLVYGSALTAQWLAEVGPDGLARFQRELGALGYRFHSMSVEESDMGGTNADTAPRAAQSGDIPADMT